MRWYVYGTLVIVVASIAVALLFPHIAAMQAIIEASQGRDMPSRLVYSLVRVIP